MLNKEGDMLCSNCKWFGDESELRTFRHPFAIDTVKVCPVCYYVENSIVGRCDEPGCRQSAIIGMVVDGNWNYRTVCNTHAKKLRNIKVISNER